MKNIHIKRFSIKPVLNFIVQRKKLLALTVFLGVAGAIPVFALGGYQAVEVVDSAAFCTQVCHKVHYPEAVTYKVSPHSEVTCAQCHVGEGTSNLVTSKFRGLKDIIPTIIGSYDKPIETPLQNRRPSSQTCETCHTSERFLGDIPLIKTTYAADQANTKSRMTLVLRVDGGTPEVAAGIHWHATAKIWYLPSDDQQKEIIWVATEDVSGNVTEYVDPNRVGEITPELIAARKRQMDCVDCHNRVTHLFRPPGELIDAALTDGSIDAKLPFIKQQGLAALVPQNKSLNEAYDKVSAIINFYKTSFPDVYQNQAQAIESSVAKLKEIAKLTTFSDGLDWNTHPNNIVHNKPDEKMQLDWATLAAKDESNGCFRCHGNLLKVDSAGQLNMAQALSEKNISQFVQRVNLTLAGLTEDTPPSASRGVPVTTGNKASFIISGDNLTAPFTLNGDNQTSPLDVNGDNKTAPIPNGAFKDQGLGAECNSCHYTLKSDLVSPLAPATPHPVDGLDDCLVCHAPNAAKPFKQDHPWASNEACSTCHQSAPKLKGLEASAPPEKAKPMPHDPKGLEKCLVCHGPAGTNPLKKEHPWATEDTCTSCHVKAEKFEPVPLSKPPVTPAIAHPTRGFEDCLSCHGQPTIMPFTTGHPWSTNSACTQCHKENTTPVQTSHAGFTPGPAVPHPTTGLTNCLSCHTTKPTHPWSNASLCGACHEFGRAGGAAGAGGAGGAGTSPTPPPLARAIPHPITGLENCLACHSQSGVRPFTADHIGRPNTMCLICHLPAGPITVPAAPGGLAASAINAGQINLSWLDNSTDETGFRVERATASGFTANLISISVAANVISYSDTTVSGSTTYYYRIFANNTAGSSAASNAASVTTPVSTVAPPSAPGGLTAIAISDAQVNLTWSDGANNESGFRVDRATNSAFTANLVLVNITANSTSYSDTTVSGGTTYYFRISAFNSGGNSAASNTAIVTTPSAVIDNAAIYAANCATCHGVNRQGGSASALTSAALASRTLAQVTTTITSGTAGMPGYSSILSSAQINSLSQWLKGSPPAAPSGLTATAVSAGRVNLGWLDNSTDETGFTIDRATDTNFTANLISVTITSNSVSYADTTVSGSFTYYYRVSAINVSGVSAFSNIASVTTPAASGSPPAAPSGLTATSTNATQVNLSWLDTSSDETGFRVDRATDSAFILNMITVNTPINSVSYSDTTVSGSTTYYYRVYSFNSAGNSASSNVASVTTPAVVLDSATIYANSCSACHGANRQGGSASALTYSALAGRTLTQITTTITSGTAGMPAYSGILTSNQINALAQWLKGSPPTAPTSLTATVVNAGRINLSWLDNSTDETGFRVERATNSAFTGLISVSVAANTVSYADMTVSGSTAYYYRVIALSIPGDSTASNTATATTPSATVPPPTAPSGLTATSTNATRVNLNWADTSNSETGFRVDRATNSGFTANLLTVNASANATAYTDTTVSGSATYYYRVYAFNAGGSSAASNTVTVTTPAPVIDAAALYSTTGCGACHGANRQGGSASALTSSALSSVTLTQITSIITNGIGTMPAYSGTLGPAQIAAIAQWLKGAPPVVPTSLAATAVNAGQVNLSWIDTDATITGYTLQRATDSAFSINMITFNITTNNTNYSDTTTSGSTTYYYRVAAINSAGNSAYSTIASVTTPASTVTIPAVPTGLTATAINAIQVNLSWTDAATNETGYAVKRATDSGFTNNVVTTNIPTPGTTSYSDTTTTSLTTYYYEVMAFNSAGSSAPSNIASVTTPAASPATIYSSNCAACHGANGQGAVSGPAIAGAATTTTTIITRNGAVTMPAFSTAQISNSDLAGLSAYVKGLAASPTTGSGIYALNCAVCHGSSGQGTSVGSVVAGAAGPTVTAIVTTGGITMPAYTTTDIPSSSLAGLVTYVTGLATAPATGSGQYTLNCAVCHGSTGQGTTKAPYVAGIPTATLTPSVVNGLLPIMPAYPSSAISSTNLAALATYIQALGPAPTDGWAVYAEYCARCHNVYGTSPNIVGVSTSTTTQATRNGTGSMPAYNTTQISNTAMTNLAAYVNGGLIPPNVPPPATPSGLTAAAASSTRVNLTWVDNSTTETGFRIQRATNSTFSTGLVTVTTTAANVINYSDTTVSAGTTYYYRVQARGATGNSAYSNTSSVTTP